MIVDMTNKRIGILTVIRYANEDEFQRKTGAYWHCKCDCGNFCTKLGKKLREGQYYSCGCYRQSIRDNAIPSNHDDRRWKSEHSAEYRKWLLLVRQRDNYRCQICGKECFLNINIHHLDAWNWATDKRFDVDNGVTLCSSILSKNGFEGCHEKFHRLFGKCNNTKEQFKIFKSMYSIPKFLLPYYSNVA